MVTIVGPRGLQDGDSELLEDIRRLETLLVDLKRIAEGWVPDTDEIRHAPLLDPYVVTVRRALSLTGGNHGHPVLRGKVIGTSELWVLAPDLGWARTLSRFYRLGRQLDEAPLN